MQNPGLTPSIGGGVYVITNAINGKTYIGSSVNLYIRYFEHAGSLRDGNHHNGHLQKAYNKYGADSFEFSIIEYVSEPTMVLEREQHHINSRRPEYNICQLATSCYGVKRSAETRAKISAYSKQRKLSPEHLDKLNASRRGKPMTDEHKVNIANALRGKKKTSEHRANLAAALKESESTKAHIMRLAEAKRGTVPVAAIDAAAKANRGRAQSPEHIAKRTARLTGRTLSDETKAKISATKHAKRLSQKPA